MGITARLDEGRLDPIPNDATVVINHTRDEVIGHHLHARSDGHHIVGDVDPIDVETLSGTARRRVVVACYYVPSRSGGVGSDQAVDLKVVLLDVPDIKPFQGGISVSLPDHVGQGTTEVGLAVPLSDLLLRGSEGLMGFFRPVD